MMASTVEELQASCAHNHCVAAHISQDIMLLHMITSCPMVWYRVSFRTNVWTVPHL